MDLFCALIDTPTPSTRTDQTSTSEDQPFPGSTRVTSTSSFVGTLLLNKNNMVLLKVPERLGALKLLLFTV